MRLITTLVQDANLGIDQRNQEDDKLHRPFYKSLTILQYIEESHTYQCDSPYQHLHNKGAYTIAYYAINVINAIIIFSDFSETLVICSLIKDTKSFHHFVFGGCAKLIVG